MLGVDRAIDGSREHHTAALLKLNERIRPGRIVRREVCPGDRDQAATVSEACQGGANVAEGGVGHAALDLGHCREGRVHQHHAGADTGAEMVIDLRRIEPGHGDAREEAVQQAGADLCKFVEHERAASQFGEDGEQAGPGRGFQHQVRRCDRGGGASSETERNRRRKLLKRLALLGAARMRRQKHGDLGQHRQHSGG